MTTWIKDKQGMLVGSEGWKIDEYRGHFIVWHHTKVTGLYFTLRAAKDAAERRVTTQIMEELK